MLHAGGCSRQAAQVSGPDMKQAAAHDVGQLTPGEQRSI